MCVEKVEVDDEQQTSAGEGFVQSLSLHTPFLPLALAFPSSEEADCEWLKDRISLLSG